MKSPFTGKEMIVSKEWHTLNFRKEKFKVLSHFYKCVDTGEQFEDDLFAELNYNQSINQYRTKYNIPFPEQIIAIREKYELSAAKMSDILGFGTNSYRLYEAGEVPSQSNGKLIQLVADPHEFRKLMQYCHSLKEKEIDKINKTIDNLLEIQKNNKVDKQLENYYLGSSQPNSLTGFKTPNINKLSEMILFFIEKTQPWKTKLNKLLFYADFYMHSKYGCSISGIRYQAIQMGPVPNNFNGIYEYLANKELFDVIYTNFSNGGTGEKFKIKSDKVFNKEQFTPQEIEILDFVLDKFKDTTTNEIIDYSHQEKAWIDNHNERNLIDYNYSFELNQQLY